MAELQTGTLAISAGTAVVGGIVGALASFLLLQRATETRVQPESGAPVAQAATPQKSPLDGRVAALERAVQGLSLRDSVARATAKAAEAPATGEPQVADVAPLVDNPVFDAAVRDVMDRSEQERTVEREAQRAEWRKQASEQWASDVTEKLRLTDAQRATAISVANGYWDKLRELRQGGDAGAPLTRQERRARMAELVASAEAELAKVLSPAQMNSYRELDEASRLGSRRNARTGAAARAQE